MDDIIYILGPTGIGKTQLAINIAREIDAEIISCDSMQIYRDLKIGTGQATLEEQQSITHHLMGEKELSFHYDANIFCQLAQECIESIKSRGKKVIITGGSGVYARILVTQENMLPSNKQIYKTLWEEYIKNGNEYIIQKLKEKTPQILDLIDIKNPRRIVRILEALIIDNDTTLKNIQQFSTHYQTQVQEFILESSIKFNRNSITLRCQKMLNNNWIDEATQAIAQGLFHTPTAWQAIGYKQIDMFLKGEIPNLEELTKKIVVQTHRYAKRQRTWFRNKHLQAKRINVEKNSLQKNKEFILKILEKN